MTALAKAFLEVKGEFFPRWDRRGTWKIKVDRSTPTHGLCEPDRRLITVSRLPADPDELKLLLIHEIAHSVGGIGHGEKWLGRMERAAGRARLRGHARLAELLLNEVANYRKSRDLEPRSWPAQIYDAIEDAVHEFPQANYFEVMRFVATAFGSRTRELESSCRRTRAAFAAATRRREVHAR